MIVVFESQQKLIVLGLTQSCEVTDNTCFPQSLPQTIHTCCAVKIYQWLDLQHGNWSSSRVPAMGRNTCP